MQLQQSVRAIQRLANRVEVCVTTTRAAHQAAAAVTLLENRLWRLVSELLPSSKWVTQRRVETGIDVLVWEEIMSTSTH